MAIAEEQQCLIEEVQFWLPTTQTSAVESACEQKIMVGLGVIIRSPQVEAVPASKTRKDQEIETQAVLLRDKVFNIAPSTLDMTQGRA